MTSMGRYLYGKQLPLPGMTIITDNEELSTIKSEHAIVRSVSKKDMANAMVLGNAHLLDGMMLRGSAEIPEILPERIIPRSLVAWSESKYVSEKSESWLHFFEDDYNSTKYGKTLSCFFLGQKTSPVLYRQIFRCT